MQNVGEHSNYMARVSALQTLLHVARLIVRLAC